MSVRVRKVHANWLTLCLTIPLMAACNPSSDVTNEDIDDEAAGNARGGSAGSTVGSAGSTVGSAGATVGSAGATVGSAGSAGATVGAAGSSGSGGKSADESEDGISGPVIAAGVRWMGRVDASDPTAVKFAWSGTGFVATIGGPTISVKLKSEGSGANSPYFQAVIDGKPGERFSVPDGEQTITLGSGLSSDDHTVELYRETEGQYGTSVFEGVVEGTVKEPPAHNGRLIEIVGDSISAGYGNLGAEQHPNYGADPDGGCRFSTETESAYETYGARAARALEADVSIIAISGWGIYRNYDGSTSGNLPAIYPNTLGTAATPSWSFGQKPHAVVINLGTNDFAQGDPGETVFKDAYGGFVSTVRSNYPDAWIYCTVGPLLWGTGLASAQAYIQAVVQDANAAGDTKVKYLDYGQQDTSKGTGCDYHPNLTEDQAMADELVPSLRSALGW